MFHDVRFVLDAAYLLAFATMMLVLYLSFGLCWLLLRTRARGVATAASTIVGTAASFVIGLRLLRSSDIFGGSGMTNGTIVTYILILLTFLGIFLEIEKRGRSNVNNATFLFVVALLVSYFFGLATLSPLYIRLGLDPRYANAPDDVVLRAATQRHDAR